MADKMSSQDFRTRYPHLAEPTVVTALGRPIGTWYPAGTEPEMRFVPGKSVAATAGRGTAPYVSTTTSAAAYRKIAARPKA